MSESYGKRTHSFVLRLWLDDDSAQGNWRGQLERVGEQEKTHFKNPSELLQAVAQWVPEFGSNESQLVSKEVSS